MFNGETTSLPSHHVGVHCEGGSAGVGVASALPPSQFLLSQSFNQSNLRWDTTPLIDFANNLVIPGKGIGDPECGTVVPAYGCMCCLKTHFVLKQCRLKSCPNCWEKWAREAATNIVTRIHDKVTIDMNKDMRVVHVVISPDQSLYDLDYKTLRQYAIRYIYAKSNLKPSGVLIFHPFRPNKKYYEVRKERYSSDDASPEDDLRKWEWIRSQPKWRDYVEFSPHFHFIGYVGWMNPPKKGEPFIYKMIVDQNGKVVTYNGDKHGTYELVYYLLTHAGITYTNTSFPSYVWIGYLAYNTKNKKFATHGTTRQPEVKKEPLKCHDCGGPLIPFEVNLKSFCRAWLHVDIEYENKEYVLSLINDETIYISSLKKNLIQALGFYYRSYMLPDFSDIEDPSIKDYIVNSF